MCAGDRTRLEQVAANLIDNAMKYTPPGGRVEVEVGARTAVAVLSVRDTGPGIPPDELPRSGIGSSEATPAAPSEGWGLV